MDSNKPIRIAYVDGLRAIAVLAVVVVHATRWDPALAAGFGPMPFSLLQYGNHGVQLFFVLSGFCLSYPTLARLHATGAVDFDVARFVAHRLVRIVPPYYCAIVVLLAAYFVLRRLHLELPSPPFDPSIFQHFSLIRQLLFLDDKDWTNPSFWTLPIEFRWYALFPVALLVWVRSPRALFTLAVVFSILVASAADSDDIQALPAFLLGIVAADMRLRGYAPARFALIASVAAFALGVMGEQSGAFNGRYNSVWVAASFFFVVAAGAVSWLERALSILPLRAIGWWSYGIYLVHEPVVAFVDAHVRFAPLASWAIASCVGLLVGIAFSIVCEQPFVGTEFSRRLSQRLRAAVPRALAFAGVPPSFALRSRRDAGAGAVSLSAQAP